MRVEAFLRESAAADPAGIAVVADGMRLSYAELDGLSDRLAASLRARGVLRGDRVVLFMENVWETPVAIFAVLKAGAVFCPVNPSVKADWLGQIMRDCRPSAVLTQAKHTRLCAEAAGALRPLVISARGVGPSEADVVAFEDCISAPAEVSSAEAGIDADLAMLIYTSGTTGRPKGVMMTHASIDAASASIAAYLGSTADDVVLGLLPLSFTYGLYQLFVTIRRGGRLVLAKSFAFPHAVIETARTEGVTGLPLVPTIAAMLLSMKEPCTLPALRYVTNAAAPLPPAHVEGLRALFPETKLFLMYGLTECARATFLPPEELDRRPGSVGRAIPNTEAYVVDENGRPAGPGVVGELVVRGPHLMRGYWENAEATDAALRPGSNPWEKVLHTGDLFVTDSEGYLTFVGRKDDMLKIRGEKVAPKQVEAVLHACPGVAEAVVTGVPDGILGLVLHAVIVPSDPPPSERDVLRHCARGLPDFMVPKTIEFRSALPRTPSGKVVRRLV
ncbi:AMP-dependent ligase [Mesorhizobium sp. L-8-10]|uniref:class I adenylate-forming enzyme family protein n=1 Tax=Mesorhizobium sp. L-8-10 TaxID=2744523 RepID=UPI001928470C|nr:class I adenylate-forming enzyme family protein [Mesorhizobium sp. L-8-10]BCH30613.1 AMP-dependent ligase [Mesorhizobium sp. L-8-10]